MSDKKVTSVSLNERNVKAMKERDESLSPLVDNWLDRYLNGTEPIQMSDKIEAEIQELEDEKEAVKRQHERLMEQYDTVIDSIRSSGEDESDDFEGELSGDFDYVYDLLTATRYENNSALATELEPGPTVRDPNHKAVKNQASKLGVSPDHLVSELLERDRRNGYETEHVEA